MSHIWDEDEYYGRDKHYDEPDELSIYKESRELETDVPFAIEYNDLYKHCS